MLDMDRLNEVCESPTHISGRAITAVIGINIDMRLRVSKLRLTQAKESERELREFAVSQQNPPNPDGPDVGNKKMVAWDIHKVVCCISAQYNQRARDAAVHRPMSSHSDETKSEMRKLHPVSHISHSPKPGSCFWNECRT